MPTSVIKAHPLIVLRAHTDAELSFRNSSDAALRFYKESCADGTFNGKCFDSCHFGTLAKGEGKSFEGLSRDATFEMAQAHARTLGFELHQFGPRTYIEEFSLLVGRGDTLNSSRKVAYMAQWVDVAIARRNRKKIRKNVGPHEQGLTQS